MLVSWWSKTCRPIDSRSPVCLSQLKERQKEPVPLRWCQEWVPKDDDATGDRRAHHSKQIFWWDYQMPCPRQGHPTRTWGCGVLAPFWHFTCVSMHKTVNLQIMRFSHWIDREKKKRISEVGWMSCTSFCKPKLQLDPNGFQVFFFILELLLHVHKVTHTKKIIHCPLPLP